MKFSQDDVLAAVVPIVLYWIYSGMYHLLSSRLADDQRIQSKEAVEKNNLVPMKTVIRGVLIQQVTQAAVILHVMLKTRKGRGSQPPFLKQAAQFMLAMGVMDTWQYFLHRALHTNKFLYRHVHSRHHRLVAPYGFAASYYHPVEGFLVETVGLAFASIVAGMTPRTAIFFFSFATIKTVDDHCGLMLPWNPLHLVFSNNAAYHDLHHQPHGIKFNFSQPFFITWDKLLGTYMKPAKYPAANASEGKKTSMSRN